MPDVELQNTQFKFRTDEVIYTIRLPYPLGPDQIVSTEANIRSRMATPAENWGNDDALVDAQACVEVKYPGWGFTVVPETDPTPGAPVSFTPAVALDESAAVESSVESSALAPSLMNRALSFLGFGTSETA